MKHLKTKKHSFGEKLGVNLNYLFHFKYVGPAKPTLINF